MSGPSAVPALASVDTDATAARDWLAAQFDLQASRGDSAAMSQQHREGLRTLSRLMWWAETDPGAEGLIVEVLPQAVRAAAALPGVSPALALYLRNVVNQAWSLSWDHRRLRLGVETACSAWAGVADEDPSGEVAALCWALLRFFLAELEVESALLTGRLAVCHASATRAADEIADLARQMAATDLPAGWGLVGREIRNELVYYETIRDVVGTAGAVLRGEVPTAEPVLAQLRARVGAADLNPTDASELRGHLRSLKAIVRAEQRPWLRVDRGHCRFIFPFGLRSPELGVDARVTSQATTQAAHWEELGGLQVTGVASGLEVSDVWRGTDPLGRAYGGATIRLEDLILETADGTPLDTIATSIRLSELGNHMVVLEVALADALPGRLAEVVHLASPLFGDLDELAGQLRLRAAGSAERRYPRLVDALERILADLQRRIRAGDGDTGIEVSALEGSFGIITLIEAATALSGPGDRDGSAVESAPQLLSLFGVESVVHPLPGGATSMADWATYDLDALRTFKLLHLSDDLLAANANLSLLASFTSPSYAVADIESYLEFAHSMHGLYQGWRETVSEHAQVIAGILQEVDRALPLDGSGTGADQAEQLGALAVRIERAELRLQAFVQSNQATMLFVDSPTLVASPALRIDLDTVLAATRYPLLRAEFERSVRDVLGGRLRELLAICHRRLEQELEQQREQRSRWVDRVFQAAGIGLALVGVSGLVSVVQAGFDLKGEVTWWLVGGILVLATIAGVVMYLFSDALSAGAAGGHRTTERRSAAEDVNQAAGRRYG